LILEIKPHSNPAREAAAVKEAVRLVKANDVEPFTEYISFSAYICEQLHTLCPQAQVAYLNGDLSPADVKAKGWTGIDYNASVLRKHPEWISEARKLGLTTNVWTVNAEPDMRHFLQAGIDFVTTNEPLLLMTIRSNDE
jgi:glycerophosphoryl diester phosphodiesterase